MVLGIGDKVFAGSKPDVEKTSFPFGDDEDEDDDDDDQFGGAFGDPDCMCICFCDDGDDEDNEDEGGENEQRPYGLPLSGKDSNNGLEMPEMFGQTGDSKCTCICMCPEEGEEDGLTKDEPEEEEEEELVDQLEELRAECTAEKKCAELKEKLEACNARVESKSKTSETCVEELIDFMHCIDHCASKSLFSKLK